MRWLLVVAMVVSLWPAGAIAAIAINDSSRTSDSKGVSSAISAEDEAQASGQRRPDAGGGPRNLSEASNADIGKRLDELEERLEGKTVEEATSRERAARAERKLASIVEDAHELSEEFVKVEFEKGVSEIPYAERGEALLQKTKRWQAKYGPVVFDQDVRGVAKAIEHQLRALDALAHEPSQEALDLYNESITEFNHALEEVSGR